MKELQTIRGEIVLIDDEDYEKAKQYRWTVFTEKNGRRRVATSIKQNGGTYKELILCLRSKWALSKNGNPLDLRRENIMIFDTKNEFLRALRSRPKKQMEFNAKISTAVQGKIGKNKKKSIYIGAQRVAEHIHPWIGKIRYKNKDYRLGCFAEDEHAALAYDKKALEIYGPNATRNFPHLTIEELTEKLKQIKEEDAILYGDYFSNLKQGYSGREVTTSQYVGVYLERSTKKWRAVIRRYNKVYQLGSYYVEEDAALAYDNMALKLYGEDAILNFDLTIEERKTKIERIRQGEIVFFEKRIPTSKYRGVGASKNNRYKKWTAKIRQNKKLYILGSFYTEEDAARAYDKKALELYGKDAKLNFPRE